MAPLHFTRLSIKMSRRIVLFFAPRESLMVWIRFILLNCLVALGLPACSGCGDDDFSGSASVSIIEVVPELGYPAVEMRVEFNIEPGSNTNAAGMTWQVEFGDGTQTSGNGTEGSATHNYASPGTYELVVKAVFDGVEVGRASQNYRVLAPVDIALDRVRGAPANVQTGAQLTVSVELSNTVASDVVAPFDVTVYFSTSGNVNFDNLESLDEFGVFRVEGIGPDAPTIANGEIRDIGFAGTVPNIASGDYFMVAVADSGNVIGDSNRQNNLNVSAGIVRVENLSDSLPDIVVSNVYAIPDRAFPTLNTITRGFTLSNMSTVDAFDVVHRTYLSLGDDVLDSADILIAESEPIDIFPRTRLEIGPDAIVLDNEIIPESGVDLKAYVIVVAETLDPAGESNPENNTGVTSPITISDQPVEGPDIVVRNFTASPDRTFLNGTLEVETTIANEGTIDVGSFFCGIYLGAQPRINTLVDPRLDNINIPTLESGGVRELTRLITVPGLYDPGTYYIYMVCDPENALQEAFRSNNAALNPGPIIVTDEADVDMYVASIKLPTNALEGEDYDAEIEICVTGTNPTGTTRAKMWITPGNTVNFTLPSVAEFEVPNINPGECETIVRTIQASCSNFVDRYAIGVEVDATKVLPELDENNNRRTSSAPVVYDGLYCTCTEDNFEPNDRVVDASLISSGSYSAAVCAAGTCDFFAVPLQAADSMIVRTTFDSSKGNLRTTLYDTTGVQILDQSAATNQQEVATFIVPNQGNYVLSVCGLAGQRNLYDLDVNVFPQSAGIDLLARALTIPTGNTFTIGSTINVNARIYNIGLTPSGSFDAEVVISSNDVIGDADDIPLTSVQIASLGGGTFRDVSIPSVLPLTLTDGSYRLGLKLDPGAQLVETDISNNTALSRAFLVNTECFDPLEPNDSFTQARDVAAGTYTNLVACTTAPDYYKLCLSEGKRFTIQTDFDNAGGDIDLELFNDQFQLIASSATAADVEQVGVNYVNGNQCFYARVVVIALPGQVIENTYSMTVDVQDVDPALLCTSSFEPNDTFATSSSLLSAVGQTFAMDRCPTTDVDYYFVDLTAGTQVTFRGILDPAAQQGTLRVQLFLPNRTPGPNIETGPGVSVAELTYLPPVSGRYFVQLTVSGQQRNVSYRLETDGLSGIDLNPTSLVIGPGGYLANDEIRFGFDLRNFGVLTAVAPPYEVYWSTSANLDVSTAQLLGTFNAMDASANSTTPVNGRVFVPATATGGTYYLHVLVDPQDVFADTNRTNNTTSTTVVVF